MTCPRCSGRLFQDGYGETVCYICGWRDYRVAQAAALAEEAQRAEQEARWLMEYEGNGTLSSRRAARRRNR